MLRTSPQSASAKMTSILLLALVVILTIPAQAQTLSVLFNFTVQGGWGPYAGVTRNAAGNLYGTTSGFGVDAGTAFELKHTDGDWIMNTLFTFDPLGGSLTNGYYPWSGVVFGPEWALYGTTYAGGSLGYGLVYRLTPAGTVCKTSLCPWTETILYNFAGGSSDGATPGLGDVAFDRAGNLYGTTMGGGTSGKGVVYKLTPSNGSWSEQVIYNFSGGSDGSVPWSGVILDAAGNLYGTTAAGGGFGGGTVYELSPSGPGWSETVLHSFEGSDGTVPYAGLIFDQSGNLYGGAFAGGVNGGGTAFELSPSEGSWTFSVLQSFTYEFDAGGPMGSLAIDGAGSLYGTTYYDGAYGLGTVFKLTPHDGSWTYTLLHNFRDAPDGALPMGGPTVDALGNIYGTTSEGGTQGCEFEVDCGTVWEITP